MNGLVVESFGAYVKERCSHASQELLGRQLAGVMVMATTDYPDELVLGLISAVAGSEGRDADAVVEDFGEYFVGWAKPRYRMAFAAPSAREFLMNMGTVHQSVRNIAKGARPPDFEYEQPGPDRLVMSYRSDRRLCRLMRGLFTGVGKNFGETIEITESRCMHKGGAECRFELRFS